MISIKFWYIHLGHKVVRTVVSSIIAQFEGTGNHVLRLGIVLEEGCRNPRPLRPASV